MWNVKTQSAKICLNFNFGGGGGDVKCQNPKCQDLSKFQFSGGRGVMWNQISLQGWSEEFGQKILEA